MKTLKCLILISLAVFLFSCDMPLALGSMLDLQGPVVEFTSPAPRKAVSQDFFIEGTAEDFSGVSTLLIKAEINNNQYPKQWRYDNGGWEVSDNFGQTWVFHQGGEWTGSNKSGIWKVPVNLAIDGLSPEDGEYLFILQGWDTGGFSDDNSYKTRVLIYDVNPPKVEVINPYLYSRHASYDSDTNLFDNAELQDVHGIDESDKVSDNGDKRRFDPTYIGKFITQSFQLQWQIEDNHDIWSIDIRFYRHDKEVDEDHITVLDDSDYIYNYHKNLPPPPPAFDSLDTVSPNGTITVPALDGTAGFYGDGGELKNPIDGKTTIKVVTICYDAAGNANQEKTIGYFVYWPAANEPWIIYPDGMNVPSHYAGKDKNALDAMVSSGDLLMIYPGRSVKATAFHAHGLKDVKFKLFKYNEATADYSEEVLGSDKDGNPYSNITLTNPPRPNGMPSNIFPWEFTPPPSTGYYVVRAYCYSYSDVVSVEYAALFMLQDISFPDFPEAPKPSATKSLHESVNTFDNSITISGIVRDATDIKNLTMVWINPASDKYAAMNQLSYFREKDYEGWRTILNDQSIAYGSFKTEGIKDSTNPNKVWKLKPNDIGIDNETTRRQFTFEQKILLTELNIATGDQPFNEKWRPLESQMFLFRAENPDGKTTIITYAPQGDTLPPRISIDNVTVTRPSNSDVLVPGEYNIINALEDGNTITINGKWEEGSAAYLNPVNYLKPRMKFYINGYNITGLTGTGTSINIGHTTGNDQGTFTVTGILSNAAGNTLVAASLKDTLVVNAEVTDIGGNYAEAGASWLIKSDDLKFLRVTSTNQSNTYTTGVTIEIFFEFNKPVKLTNQSTPEIILNALNGSTRVIAKYKQGQQMEDTRQYFEYTVKPGDNTPTSEYLNVSSLDTEGILWSNNTYPFRWEHTMENGGKEHIRITEVTGHNGGIPAGQTDFYAHALPTSGMYSLVGSRNIKIDTAAPGFSAPTATPAGWHTVGAEIFINVKFSKPVKAGTGANAPYLTILGRNTSTNPEDIRVNNDIITFKYTVAANDNSNGNPLQITGSGGVITDLVNTPMEGSITGTLAGIYIDTITPAAPTVEIRSGGNIISNIVSGNTVQGTSGGVGLTTGTGNQWPTAGSAPTDTVNNLRNLQTIYYNDLSLQITRSGSTTAQDLNKIEYSVNYGADWQDYSTGQNAGTAIAWGSSAPNGVYQITARQIDSAGNVSNWARPVTFNWDKGDNFVTRIDSFTPNGTYTYNSVRQNDQVEIVLQLRKQINITAAQITLNAVNSGGNAVTVAPVSTGNVDRLTFRYNVANGHTTNGANLTVSAVSITATDSTNVNVTAFASKLPASALILPGKEIKVQTGGLTVYNNANPSFTGGVYTNDTYTATLTLEYARYIYKNTGSITIEQQRNEYKLPAVLTEAQAARFSGIAGFSTYYTRGTNGYNYVDENNRSADTTPKYILNYTIDTSSALNQPTTSGTGGSVIQQMAEAFRVAESVVIPVTAAAVTIVNNTTTGRGTLNVTLTGTNALQVLGANYLITIPADFVQDELSNLSPAIIEHNINIGQVSRPFIRIRKTQDTISISGSPSTSQPRLVAHQPFQAQVRMDSRTPNARIFYIAASAVTTTNAVNWSTSSGPTGTTAAPAQPADPRTTTANREQYSAPFSIGTDNDYQGLQWYARVKATTSTAVPPANTANLWSENSEQMAFKTVVTYVANGIASGDTGQPFGDGDQLWIRGGDAIGSSSIPGYPLTWEDNWIESSLQNKRAGIRLFTRTTSDNTSLNSSTFKWITWEITVDTYFDIILGRDTASSADQAWQYGPRGWAYQRAGWTSFKLESRILPGQHRWLQSNSPDPGKGTLNFSGTWMARSNLSTNYTLSALNKAYDGAP
ncbi:MAG: hypothetical protein FWB95_01190 [Treponema sp.]|nr:hypothetical protein [Treponema sp.]